MFEPEDWRGVDLVATEFVSFCVLLLSRAGSRFRIGHFCHQTQLLKDKTSTIQYLFESKVADNGSMNCASETFRLSKAYEL